VGFDGARDEKLPRVLHETTKENKGLELALRGLKCPPPIDIEDMDVSPLHVIFDLKGVLVGKDYFKINHLLPSSFNLVRSRTLLSKTLQGILSIPTHTFVTCVQINHFFDY
jgi:hypothetical protein